MVTDFDAWLAGVRSRILASGVPQGVLDAAFADVAHLPQVVERDRDQAEFATSLRDYLAVAVSEARVAGGRHALRDHAALLDRIEAGFGVAREVVVAIWGVETSFGAHRGDVPTVSALATLAFDGRRGAFFEGQLLAALRILAAGEAAPEAMVGSWAGAMGHTQFMPGTYLARAVDFDGDGRRDVWGEDPTDALASTAATLAAEGWTPGQPWAVEVVLPPGFDHALARPDLRRDADHWASLGVRDPEGREVPVRGEASIWLPAGAAGPALLSFDNALALRRYNAADAYVLAVGHLADRLRGDGPFRADWPGDRPLARAELRDMQERLTALGFDTQGADGLMGPRTAAAVRSWQMAAGEIPDGHPTPALLERLRR